MASIQILITDALVALAIELLSFGLWEPSATQSLAPQLIRISHSQKLELYKVGPPTVLTVVDVFVKNPSESELIYDVIMWISFGFSGRSELTYEWCETFLLVFRVGHGSSSLMWMNCWTPCWSSQSLPKSATWNPDWINVSWAQRKIESFYYYFFPLMMREIEWIGAPKSTNSTIK